MMYEGFAGVYDRLMADVDYDRWAEFYLAVAERAGVQVRRAADCACGTGNLTLALQGKGLQMTGLDLSPDMLRVAGQKARARGMQLPFVRQDMRKLLLHRPQDAIFCACDGVNYLVRPADVQAFFAAAYGALRPGGGLFFDVSTEHKLSHTLGNQCLGSDDDAVAYLWQNHYDTEKRALQMDLTFFVREPDGRYGRFGETHFQRAHTQEELTAWLREAGFAQVSTYGNRTLRAPGEACERMHLAAVKPQEQHKS